MGWYGLVWFGLVWCSVVWSTDVSRLPLLCVLPLVLCCLLLRAPWRLYAIWNGNGAGVTQILPLIMRRMLPVLGILCRTAVSAVRLTLTLMATCGKLT